MMTFAQCILYEVPVFCSGFHAQLPGRCHFSVQILTRVSHRGYDMIGYDKKRNEKK